MAGNTRVPLVVFSPKSMLRHRLSQSSLGELTSGTSFQPVLQDDEVAQDLDAVQRVVMCSGKIYWELLEARRAASVDGLASPPVAFVRVEQLYPFPAAAVRDALARYGNADELVWCQEEPRNRATAPLRKLTAIICH